LSFISRSKHPYKITEIKFIALKIEHALRLRNSSKLALRLSLGSVGLTTVGLIDTNLNAMSKKNLN